MNKLPFFVFIIPTNDEEMMQLGFLEETVLLLILSMEEEAYGFTVSEAYQKHTGKSISISAVHTVMSRLEEKKLIESFLGGATEVRGGRRKRIFKATSKGIEAVQELKAARERLWGQLPDLI